MGNLDEHKGDYLKHRVLLNLSPLTVRQTEQGLRLFIAFLRERGIDEVERVDAECLEEYKAYLRNYITHRGRRLSSCVIRERIYMNRKWFEFLRKRGVLQSNPLADVMPPRFEKTLPKCVFRRDEIQKIMGQPNLRGIAGYRDRTIMEVLYSTGLRAAELVLLAIADVNFERKVLRVRHGKGGRERYVPLSTPTCRFLARYLKTIRPELLRGVRPYGRSWKEKQGMGGEYLFLSIYGGPISNTALAALMTRHIRRAGIIRPIQPIHGFRHSVATHLLENGMDIRYVQAFLGHMTINSTQIYTHVEKAALKRLLTRHHPRELAADAFVPFRGEQEKRHDAAA